MDFLEDHDWVYFPGFNDIRCGINHIRVISGRYLSCLPFTYRAFVVSRSAAFNRCLLFILLLDECLINVLEDRDRVLEFAIVYNSLIHVFNSLSIHFEIRNERFCLSKMKPVSR